MLQGGERPRTPSCLPGLGANGRSEDLGYLPLSFEFLAFSFEFLVFTAWVLIQNSTFKIQNYQSLWGIDLGLGHLGHLGHGVLGQNIQDRLGFGTP